MFNKDEAYKYQNSFVEKSEKIHFLLKEEVVDYYRNRYPDDEEQAIKYLREIRNYLDEAYKDLDYMLDDLDKKLGF